MGESSDSQRFRRPSGGSSSVGAATGDDTEADGPTSTPLRASAGVVTPNATASAQAPIKTAGKTTVQFSDVVQCASQLQAMYGHRCKDHPWGCVEITEDRHLELTMKMYLDWAGLVVRIDFALVSQYVFLLGRLRAILNVCFFVCFV